MAGKDDRKIKDALGQKRRGRPPTGKALSAAERKRRQRLRATQSVRDVRQGKAKTADLSLTALYAEIQKGVEYGDVDLVKLISKELLKRAAANDQLEN